MTTADKRPGYAISFGVLVGGLTPTRVSWHPWVMAVRILLFAPLALFACSGHPNPPTDTETSPVVSCGPDGYSLPDALPGDTYLATDPAIRSVVVSNGEVDGAILGGEWSGVVRSRTSTTVPLVIQLRDVEHRTLCTGLN